MRTQTHDERAALVLATAAVVGDKEAARRHNCSERTVRDWRQREAGDSDLASACQRARARILRREWVDDLDSTIRDGIRFIQRAAASAEVSDPKTIVAVARALRILGELAAWHEATGDVRASGVCQEATGPGGPIQSGQA